MRPPKPSPDALWDPKLNEWYIAASCDACRACRVYLTDPKRRVGCAGPGTCMYGQAPSRTGEFCVVSGQLAKENPLEPKL